MTSQVLAMPDTTLEQRAEAYQLQGCALAGSDQIAASEEAFRHLLQIRLDFHLPANTSPKIQEVFNRVQARGTGSIGHHRVGNPYLAAGRSFFTMNSSKRPWNQLSAGLTITNTPPPRELVQIHIYQGLVQLSLGNVDLGRSSFRAALNLNGNARLPVDASAKAIEVWKSAQAAPVDGSRPGFFISRPNLQAEAAPLDAAQTAVIAPTPSSSPRSTISSVGPFATLGVGVVLAGVGAIFAVDAYGESRPANASTSTQPRSKRPTRPSTGTEPPQMSRRGRSCRGVRGHVVGAWMRPMTNSPIRAEAR